MSDFAIINRYALILLPTEECVAWINSCPGKPLTLAEVQKEPTVYLIPAGSAGAEGCVRRHFRAIFEQELNSWYTDPDFWPKDRSLRTFKKFFSVQVSTVVFDLGKGMIVKE